MKLSAYLYVLLFFYITTLFAQEKPLTAKAPETKKFPIFFEKVYLHTDRNYYSTGDDIWFKAYMVNAINHIEMETSKVLYVELISGDTTYFKQLKININKGVGTGDFQLPDTIPSGTYTLRAYTNWMLNFGDLFIFNKELKIINTQETTPLPHRTSYQKPIIGFYPEGGSAITEAFNNVAFKAVNGNGKGCDAFGIIVSSDNDTICKFNTIHKGMGSFTYMPLPGKKYFAIGTINNTPFKIELPEPLVKGYGMQVLDLDTAYFYASIYTNQATLDEHPNEIVIINALSHNKSVFTEPVKINDLKTDIKIPKQNFLNGVACITLYDTLLRAHCQRLFNIAKSQNNIITLKSDKQEYKPKEKVTVSFKLTDKQGNPVKTKLSFVAVDSKIAPVDHSNIKSYLLLESEIRGKIEEPDNYFDATNPLRNKQLDLLLLTQGWRDFIWRRVKDTTISIKYIVEPALCISGWVRKKFDKDPVANMNISAYIPGAANRKLFFTKTNKNGYFYIEGTEFYGRKNILITSQDQKGNKSGWLRLDSMYKPALLLPPLNYETDTSDIKSNFEKESVAKKKMLRKFSLTDTILLNEVVISAVKERENRQLIEHIAQAGTPTWIFPFTEEELKYADLSFFMFERIPGARKPDHIDPGYPFNRIVFSFMGEIDPPTFIVNGRRYAKGDKDAENYVYNLPLSDIERIMVTKGYTISVFLKPYNSPKKVFHTINTQLNGYYQTRVFYSPIYQSNNNLTDKPDLRTTLFWNPSLETNEKGECTTTFYNSDKKTSVRISAEGITEEGTPVVVTGSYDVR